MISNTNTLGVNLKNDINYDVSIIIPIYNEEESIPLLVDSLMELFKELVNLSYEVIFINDGSIDKSQLVIEKLLIDLPKFKLINFRRNYGQTSAMMAGIDYSSGRIIIPMDADLQNDPVDIPRLLAKIDEGYDVVSGWRVDRKDDKLKRNFLSYIANLIISYISGVKLHDYGCTLKAYRADVVKNVRLYGEMHRFIPIYASWMGAKVVEIPVIHHARKYGKSKYGLSRIIKVILDLIVVKFLEKYFVKPIYIFGGIGLINITISFVLLFISLYLKIVNGTSFILTPLPLLSVIIFLLGVLSILLGLIAELLVRTYFESQDKTFYKVLGLKNFERI
jgi:dolichol-phosphate mannosyltransferase